MDEVLRAALVLPDPANFLTSPSVPVDWRQPLDRARRATRSGATSLAHAGRQRRPAAKRASTRSRPSDREPPSDSPLEDRLPRPTPSTDIGYPTPEPAIREE